MKRSSPMKSAKLATGNSSPQRKPQETAPPSQFSRGINEIAIPLDNGSAAVIPIGMKEETFNLLISTLQLWKNNLVEVPPKQEEEGEK